jgi:maltose alpha-D-glucosyltransferase/alpha-amylase
VTTTKPVNGEFEITDDPYWYKDAVIYEVHVRAFYDSDGDGIGDFAGLTQKLDYLQELGITALWLLPFYPSPLLDDGYDIADYTDVHPSYGTLRDARNFIREAHRRGIRVITELVCNHTSDQHPWFQRARRAAPDSAWRNFYVWSDTPEKYKEVRIIFKDFEPSNWSFDQVAGSHYWHRFFRHQPDLNFDNPRVHVALRRAMDFWMEMGVDGMRLDAIPYLYEREGTSSENLPEGFEFLRQLRSHIDAKFPGRMLLAEANQWPEDAVAYFGEGDMCQMSFHFPLMPRLFMGLYMEDRFPIVDILRQTPPIPDNCQWAVFLRNHDELTLEMVTDEERDYMYRVYATDARMRINLGIRRRLAPLLGNHRRRVELMNGLLFSLPGTPVIYYGDELGMGDNVYLGDRNGVRTPMQWSADRNAGFSRVNPQQLYLPVITDPEYHYETLNAEQQIQNQHSLYWWTRRIIALRKRYKAFSRGTMEIVPAENRKIFAFVRQYEDERILVVANLSRFVQGVELDLSRFQGMRPVEIFGRVDMPLIGEHPYFLTMGPHSFYWFSLERQRAQLVTVEEAELPPQALRRSWEELLQPDDRDAIEAALPAFLHKQRWFSGKARSLRGVTITDVLPINRDPPSIYLALASLQYLDATPETQVLTLAYAAGDVAAQRKRDLPDSIVMRVRAPNGEEGIIYDAAGDESFAIAALQTIERRGRIRSSGGELTGLRTAAFEPFDVKQARPQAMRREQSNSAVLFGDKAMLKLFRKVEPGVNPDLEIGRRLTEMEFPHSPHIIGALEYGRAKQERSTLAVLYEFVENEGDAWGYTVDMVGDYFDRVLADSSITVEAPPATAADLLYMSTLPVPDEAVVTIGSAFIDMARLLGTRTAEMHSALASIEDQAFVPEQYTPFYQRALYQSMRNLTSEAFSLLRNRARMSELPPAAHDLLSREEEVLGRLRSIVGRVLQGHRQRIHGDYHLGQVLYTGNDFSIIDYEGEPARPLGERKIKRSALRDVAGMLRSFDYAVQTALRDQLARGMEQANEARAQAFGRYWQAWVSAAYLSAYLETATRNKTVATDSNEVAILLDVWMIEKAVYELGYELNNRPDWLEVPALGLQALLESQAES